MAACRQQLGMLGLIATLGCAFTQAAGQGASAPTPEEQDAGWTFAFDDDLLTVSGRDRDYTGGLTLTFAGQRTANWRLSLDRIAAKLDALVPDHAGNPTSPPLHAMQFGVLAFTPRRLNTHAALPDDRPYASLVFASGTRLFADETSGTAYDTSVAVGVLGLAAVGAAQRQLHFAMNAPDIPNGWRHQVSNGGEPTLRASWGREQLLAQDRGSTRGYDALWRIDASVGYLTDASVALAGRWGRLRSPWWSGGVARGDYAQLAPTLGLPPAATADRELYISAGVRARLRVYNAFLQGQFRHSEVVVPDSRLERMVAEGWVAANWRMTSALELSYLMRLQTPEIRSGEGRRALVWAGLTLAYRR